MQKCTQAKRYGRNSLKNKYVSAFSSHTKKGNGCLVVWLVVLRQNLAKGNTSGADPRSAVCVSFRRTFFYGDSNRNEWTSYNFFLWLRYDLLASLFGGFLTFFLYSLLLLRLFFQIYL